VTLPKIRTGSRHSLRAVPTQRSANAFALGARTGVFTTVSPSVRKTSSNGPENFESRSRSRIRLPSGLPAIARFRACCVPRPSRVRWSCRPHGPVWSRARRRTGRRGSSGTVSIVKKSHASAPLPCARRNWLQVRPVRRGARRGHSGEGSAGSCSHRPGSRACRARPVSARTPPGILFAETDDEISGLGLEWRPPGASLVVGPFAPHELAVPPKERLRRDHERGPAVSGDRPAHRRGEHPAAVLELRATNRAPNTLHLMESTAFSSVACRRGRAGDRGVHRPPVGDARGVRQRGAEAASADFMALLRARLAVAGPHRRCGPVVRPARRRAPPRT
jgi:hypothetical protein